MGISLVYDPVAILSLYLLALAVGVADARYYVAAANTPFNRAASGA
jgi:hypothetical protein